MHAGAVQGGAFQLEQGVGRGPAEVPLTGYRVNSKENITSRWWRVCGMCKLVLKPLKEKRIDRIFD